MALKALALCGDFVPRHHVDGLSPAAKSTPISLFRFVFGAGLTLALCILVPCLAGVCFVCVWVFPAPCYLFSVGVSGAFPCFFCICYSRPTVGLPPWN
jgi:hypothetical protein